MGIFTRKNELERVCDQTGWLIIARKGTHYWIQNQDPGPTLDLMLRYGDRMTSLIIQYWLNISFSLENPPSGLFGRVLMRSLDLYYPAWMMTIDGRCEATLGLAARLPRKALEPELFNDVCREIVDEVSSFRKELRDKFRYDIAGVSPRCAPGGGGSGVPATRPDNPTSHARYPINRR